MADQIVYFCDPSNDDFKPLTGGTTGVFTATKHNGKRNQKIEVPNVIYNAIAMGLDIRTAAHLAGVDEDSFYNWLREDPVLERRINEAKAWGINFVAAKLWKAINRDEKWAILFFLGRRADEFKEQKEVINSGITEESLKEIIKLIANKDSLLPKEEIKEDDD